MLNHRMKRVLSLCLILVLAGYCGAYVALRASHRIMHFSNAQHPHPEKWSPEHHVDVTTGDDWVIDFAFQPLMFLERTVRNATD